MCCGVPKPGDVRAPLRVEMPLQRRAEHRDAQLDRDAPARTAGRARASAPPLGRLLAAADVGDDEHVQDHHRARVDDHLRGGDELGAQQQEQRRERDQVDASASTL